MAIASVGGPELAAMRAGARDTVPRVAITTQCAAQLPEHHLVWWRMRQGRGQGGKAWAVGGTAG